MRLYHGTNKSSAFDIVINGIDLCKSNDYLDFGKGFYLTDSLDKAQSRARSKTSIYNKRYNADEDAYIVTVAIDKNKFKQLNVKEFTNSDLEWCEFVLNNRLSTYFLEHNNITNHNRDNKYDIVCGEIADGKISQIANDIKNNKLKLSEVDYNKIYTDNKSYYGYQMSLHTKKALSCIVSVSCGIINQQ